MIEDDDNDLIIIPTWNDDCVNLGKKKIKGASEHRATCHRCGNMRKSVLQCTNCPYIFCRNCTSKMYEEHGVDIFTNGCPVCKDLCCCGSRKSKNCQRIHHCYKKCLSMRGLRGPSRIFRDVDEDEVDDDSALRFPFALYPISTDTDGDNGGVDTHSARLYQHQKVHRRCQSPRSRNQLKKLAVSKSAEVYCSGNPFSSNYHPDYKSPLQKDEYFSALKADHDGNEYLPSFDDIPCSSIESNQDCDDPMADETLSAINGASNGNYYASDTPYRLVDGEAAPYNPVGDQAAPYSRIGDDAGPCSLTDNGTSSDSLVCRCDVDDPSNCPLNLLYHTGTYLYYVPKCTAGPGGQACENCLRAYAMGGCSCVACSGFGDNDGEPGITDATNADALCVSCSTPYTGATNFNFAADSGATSNFAVQSPDCTALIAYPDPNMGISVSLGIEGIDDVNVILNGGQPRSESNIKSPFEAACTEGFENYSAYADPSPSSSITALEAASATSNLTPGTNESDMFQYARASGWPQYQSPASNMTAGYGSSSASDPSHCGSYISFSDPLSSPFGATGAPESEETERHFAQDDYSAAAPTGPPRTKASKSRSRKKSSTQEVASESPEEQEVPKLSKPTTKLSQLTSVKSPEPAPTRRSPRCHPEGAFKALFGSRDLEEPESPNVKTPIKSKSKRKISTSPKPRQKKGRLPESDKDVVESNGEKVGVEPTEPPQSQKVWAMNPVTPGPNNGDFLRPSLTMVATPMGTYMGDSPLTPFTGELLSHRGGAAPSTNEESPYVRDSWGCEQQQSTGVRFYTAASGPGTPFQNSSSHMGAEMVSSPADNESFALDAKEAFGQSPGGQSLAELVALGIESDDLTAVAGALCGLGSDTFHLTFASPDHTSSHCKLGVQLE